MANSKTLTLRQTRPPSGRVGGIAGKDDVEVEADQRVAESLPSAAGAELSAHSTFDRAQQNGDETDGRMAEIEVILDHAAMHLLEKCSLVAEWVHIADASISVFGQFDQKPQGGRPEGGIARAARALPVPGKTTEARRKFIERAIKINCIWPEAKVAARTARLDDRQSALLTIADEKTLEAQLAKVTELANRKPRPRDKKKAAVSEPAATGETNARASIEIIELESFSDEQEANFVALKASWTEAGILPRDDWEKSGRSVQSRFIHDFLLIEEIAS
jgi:hypothetical protein